MRSRPRRRTPTVSWALLVTLPALVATACQPAADTAAPTAHEVLARPASSGQPALTAATCPQRVTATAALPAGVPDLVLRCLAGQRRDLHSVARGPVVLNLWASWCQPCMQELPRLQRAHASTGTAVRFLGVSTRDDPHDSAAVMTRLGITYPDVADIDGGLLAALHLPGLPVTLVFDSAGREVLRHVGEVPETSLRRALARAAASGDRVSQVAHAPGAN